MRERGKREEWEQGKVNVHTKPCGRGGSDELIVRWGTLSITHYLSLLWPTRDCEKRGECIINFKLAVREVFILTWKIVRSFENEEDTIVILWANILSDYGMNSVELETEWQYRKKSDRTIGVKLNVAWSNIPNTIVINCAAAQVMFSSFHLVSKQIVSFKYFVLFSNRGW